MNVTILTDASWDPILQVAGYGYWIASDRGKRPGGGPFRGRVTSSNQAEMQAVVNALHIALREGLVQSCDAVLFQVDSLHALNVLSGKQEPVVEIETGILRQFRALAETNRLEIIFRHVKGHTKQKDNKFLANAHCDERAKSGMRKARHLFSTTGANKEQK